MGIKREPKWFKKAEKQAKFEVTCPLLIFSPTGWTNKLWLKYDIIIITSHSEAFHYVYHLDVEISSSSSSFMIDADILVAIELQL